MKKQKIISALSLCAILCLLLLSLTACRLDDNNPTDSSVDESKTSVNYTVAFAKSYAQDEQSFGTKYAMSSIESDLKVKIDTLDELTSISEENEFPFFDENSENYNSALSKKIRGYEDEFFAEKSLILVFSFGTEYKNARVVNVSLSNYKYIVTLSKPNTAYKFDTKNDFVYIIEIEKNANINTKSIEIKTVSNGRFYTLEDAWEEGILSQEEVKSIIYYHNNGKEYVNNEFVTMDYTPIPRDPAELPEETKNAIRSTLVDYFYYMGVAIGETTERETMNSSFKYFGTYDGRIAIHFNLNLMFVPSFVDTVAGFTYFPKGALPILIWENQ